MRSSQPRKRVLFVLTSCGTVPGVEGDLAAGYSLLDLARSYRVLSTYRCELHIASVEGGHPFADPNSADAADDDVQWILTTPRLQLALQYTDRIGNHHGYNWDALYFVGGYGTLWDFPRNEDIQRVARECYERGGVVGAVGHGVAALFHVRLSSSAFLLEGKQVTGISNAEESEFTMLPYLPAQLESGERTVQDVLQTRGATYTATHNNAAHVCVDERLVTGQNPNSAEGVANRIFGLLSSAREEEEDEVQL